MSAVEFAVAGAFNGLWVTNGTAEGTYELTGIAGAAPAPNPFNPQDFTDFNGLVYFAAVDANNVSGLWVTDGTAAGTQELTGIAGADTAPSFGLAPSDLTPFGDIMLFQGVDAGGLRGLWVTDGTAAGTRELTGIAGASASFFDPTDFTVFGGEVLSSGSDASGATGLWVTDGTAAGTHELTGVAGAGASLEPTDLTVLGGAVLFNGADAAGLSGLWLTGGTAAGTHELSGIVGASSVANADGTRGLNPTDVVTFDGKAYFAGEDASGLIGLWVTDGTVAGTHELTGIAGASTGADRVTLDNNSSGLNPSNLTVYNGELLFSGWDANGLIGLWVSNGTAAGTHELVGIPDASTTAQAGGLDSPFHAGLEPMYLTEAGGLVFFSGHDLRDDTGQIDTGGATGLWVTDGTVAGTRELSTAVEPTDIAALGSAATSPVVEAAFAAPAAGDVASGSPATIALDFQERMTVTGHPTLTLSDGETATYVGGSGTNGLVFSVSPAATGDSLAMLTPTAIHLAGGSIDDASGAPADLSLTGLSVTPAGDIIVGAPGMQVLLGHGDDVFFAGGGVDLMIGGPGVDTAVFTGTVSQYAISESAGEIKVVDGVAGRDGTATLENVQQAQFANATLVFDLHSSQDLLVYELYQAAFDRIPDTAGFRYWADVADANHTSALALADAFLAAPEFADRYATNLSNQQFVTELYANVLGRQPDQAGLDYWVGQANAGQPYDQLLVDFATSAENVALIAPHTSLGYWTLG